MAFREIGATGRSLAATPQEFWQLCYVGRDPLDHISALRARRDCQSRLSSLTLRLQAWSCGG